MKKIKSLFCTLLLSVCLCSCGNSGGGGTSSSTHTHSWTLKSDTATCKESGTKTYKCSCGQTKTESSPKKDHEYNATAQNCKWCGKYKYDITVTNTIPFTASWNYSKTGHCYSKCDITELSFYTYNNKVQLFGYAKKTYDEDGEESGTTAINFQIKLICTTDEEVLGITKIFKYGLAVGQKFTFDESSNIPTYDLSLNKKYTATIMDYNI